MSNFKVKCRAKVIHGCFIYEVLLQRSTYMWICAVSIKFHQLEYLVFENKILEVFWKGKISTFELFWNKRFQVFALFWNKMQTPQIFLPRSLCKQRGPRDLGIFVNLWKYILGNFLNCFFVNLWKYILGRVKRKVLLSFVFRNRKSIIYKGPFVASPINSQSFRRHASRVRFGSKKFGPN